MELSLHGEPWPRVGLKAHQVPSLGAASPSLPPQLPSSCPCPSPHSKFSSLLCCHLLFQKLLHIACPPPPWGGLCVCVHVSGSQVLCLCVPVCTSCVEHTSSVCMWLCHVTICMCNMLVSCWGVCVCVRVCVCVWVACRSASLHMGSLLRWRYLGLKAVAPGGPIL